MADNSIDESESEKQDVIEVPYPFTLEKIQASWDADGNPIDGYVIPEIDSYRPGTFMAPVYPDDAEAAADAMGHMLLREVKRCELPDRYHDRVFYIRWWRDPRGREFGKKNIRVTTVRTFEKLQKGYRYPFFLQSKDNPHV